MSRMRICRRCVIVVVAVVSVPAVIQNQAHADLTFFLNPGPLSNALELQQGPGQTSNLGSFDVVINAGATLAGNAAALAAFNRAAEQWEAFVSDPITVNVSADLAPLGAGILGSTSSVQLFASYSTIRGAMVTDASDEADDAIVASLPATSIFTMPAGFSQHTTSGVPNLQATKANLKALGFGGLDGAFGTSDGSITFSTAFSFDFDNSDGVTAGFHDFETVAAHEIGHLLGFISIVDYIDFRINNSQTASDVLPTSLDMYRFDNDGASDPADATDFSTMTRSLIPGNEEIFDQISGTDGGDAEVLMSTGLTQGDGRQASHWKDGFGLGLMDPTLATEEISPITANDLRGLDLIGYEIIVVPEARAYLMLAAAACLIGLGAGVRRLSIA